MEYGMTHEQIKNFVVNSHVTENRKLRQVLVEVERRNHEKKKVLFDIERKKIEIERSARTVGSYLRMSLIDN